MEFESAHSNTTAKLPILKLGEYEMWVIRIKQYFQVQDYALWEVIENGNSWVSVPQTTQENGTSVTKMSVPVTVEEKTNKKNDVKVRSLLLMALPNEHQLTFSQYTDAKIIFAAIETRFRESLDSIFNRLQKIVSRLAILRVVIAQEDLNSKFLNSLPPEWNTNVVVWINKAEIETMSIDDLYNNFKIVKQSVKKSIGASSGSQNLSFMTAPSTNSTNDVNTTKPTYEVSTVSPNVNTASPQVSTASFSDNAVYAFMVENPNGSNLLQQDLEQIHEDDLEAMDLKWQLSPLSMRANRYYQRTSKKIFINANDTARYDKSKVECFNCHKMRHFARECRALKNKEGQFKNQDNTRKQGNNEDTSSKVMLAIDGVGFDSSDMAKEEVQTNMALWHFQTQRGLATLEEQLITYKKNEVLFSEEVAVLKKDVACKDYEINVLKIPPPIPLIYNRPKKLDLSYSGLDEFKEPEFKGYGPENSKQESNIVCDKKSDDSKKNSDNSLVKEQVSKDTSSFVESSLNVDKEIVFPGNQRNWNGQKSNQLGSVFVMYNKLAFICGICNHDTMLMHNNHQREGMVYGNTYKRVNYNYTTNRTHPNAQRNMVPRAVLMKTGLKTFNTARTVNTAHPKSIGQAVNTARPKIVNTARPNSAVVNAVRSKPQQDDTGFVDSGCSRHMTGNIALSLRFQEIWMEVMFTFGGRSLVVEFLVKRYNLKLIRTQGELNASTSEEISQDCIDGDGPDNENDEQDKSDDVSSPKEVNAVGQHVNTASPDVNLELVIHLKPLMLSSSVMKMNHKLIWGTSQIPIHFPTTPNTRIHKDHPIKNVIGDVKSSVQTRRMTKPTSKQGFLSAVEAMQEELLQLKTFNWFRNLVICLLDRGY
ncbi:putative ribonuclease H-like domain-containing protein [Tanacetum coccineum]